MKNKQALVITIAALVALISLSCTAVQRPLSRPMHRAANQKQMMHKMPRYADRWTKPMPARFIDPTISRITDPKMLKKMISLTENRIRKDSKTLEGRLRNREREQQLKRDIRRAQERLAQYRARLSTLQSQMPVK